MQITDWLKGLSARIRGLGRTDAALNDELQFHLDQLVRQLQKQGVPDHEALRRAHVELGGKVRIQEECRDQLGANWLSDLSRDTSLAIRKLRREPGFALAAIFILALGIGLNTALFTVLYGVIFRPLPVKDPGSVRNVYVELTGAKAENRSSYGSQYFQSFAEFRYMRQRAKTMELAATAEAQMSVRGLPVKSLRAQLVSSNLLSLMGGAPIHGRFFLPEETDRPGSAPVVVLSHAAWVKYFGSAPDAVGRTLLINRGAFTVIGVANAGFHGPLVVVPDMWIPVTMQARTRPGESLVDDPNAGFIQTFGRARPGFTDSQVQAELAVLGQQAVRSHGSARQAHVQVVRASFLNYPDVMALVGPGLLVVWLAGAMVLLVACTNVANLLLARGLSRRREIAIRLAVGASRFRLLRQMLSESLLLGLVGGLLGLLLAWRGGSIGLKFVPAEVGQLQLNVAPDPWVLFFALLMSVLAALACGLLPAFHALRVDLTPSLKSEGLLDTRTAGGSRLQRVLVGVQVAVSVVLLVNAGLMLRGFTRAALMDTGRNMHGLLIASFDLRQQQYTPEKAQSFHERLTERLKSLPDVTAVTVSLQDPELSHFGSSASAAGQGGETVRVSFDEVGPDYFKTAGIQLREGRSFTAAEVKSDAKVGLIDEGLAQRLFAGKALGRQVAIPTGAVTTEAFTVVGVVARTKSLSVGTQPGFSYYIPLRGLRFMEAKLWIRYRGAPVAVNDAIRTAVLAEDPDVTPTVHTIEENVKTALTPVLVASWAASALGLLALAVAAIGLYGVISFAVNRRLHEMGVRMALGANGGDLRRLVLGQLPGAVGLGSVVGMAAAVGMATLLRSILYGVSPLDPLALVCVTGILTLVCIAAAWGPARRASRVDPASVLRSE